MEPLNKGHVGTRSFVLYREVYFIRKLKYTGIIGIGTSRFVLYREVFFIRSVLYRRFHFSYLWWCICYREVGNCVKVSWAKDERIMQYICCGLLVMITQREVSNCVKVSRTN